MNMEMVDSLASLFAIINDDSIAVCQPLCLGSFGCHHHQVPEKTLMFLLRIDQLGQAISIFRYDQEMRLGDWSYVSKSHTRTIFIKYIDWDLFCYDFIKNGHLFGSSSWHILIFNSDTIFDLCREVEYDWFIYAVVVLVEVAGVNVGRCLVREDSISFVDVAGDVVQGLYAVLDGVQEIEAADGEALVCLVPKCKRRSMRQ